MLDSLLLNGKARPLEPALYLFNFAPSFTSMDLMTRSSFFTLSSSLNSVLFLEYTILLKNSKSESFYLSSDFANILFKKEE